MSTKWQKSCIEALVTSPLAFKLFRAEQIGIKMMDQYLDKIWPYKLVKQNPKASLVEINNTNTKETPGKFKEMLHELLKIFTIAKYGDALEIREININVERFYYWVKDNVKLGTSSNLHFEHNAFQMRAKRITGSTRIADKIFFTPNETIWEYLKLLIAELHENAGTEAHFKHISFNTNITTEQFVLTKLYVIKELQNALGIKSEEPKKIKVRKLPLLYKSINIGIEIEYEGCNCQSLEKQLLANGAIDFNSGYDGGGTDGSLDPEGRRLRENRLRISGMKGLKALYILLEWMKNNGCQIDIDSGMHFHIDCRDMKEEITLSSIKNDLQKKMTDLSSETIKHIFNIYEKQYSDNSSDIRIFFWNNIKCQSEFQTLEWRMASATLNYTTLALQILVAIHLTECGKYKQKMPNEQYLRMLGEISNGMRNLPVKQY